MVHEDGFCDTCGADIGDEPAWLTLTGDTNCRSCACSSLETSIRTKTAAGDAPARDNDTREASRG